MSAPPQSAEFDKPMQRDNPPALSSLDLHGNYWEIHKSTSCSYSTSSSAQQQHSPRTAPSSPQQVCFFVGSQDEPHSPAQ